MILAKDIIIFYWVHLYFEALFARYLFHYPNTPKQSKESFFLRVSLDQPTLETLYDNSYLLFPVIFEKVQKNKKNEIWTVFNFLRNPDNISICVKRRNMKHTTTKNSNEPILPSYLRELNFPQREAVLSLQGPVLMLAGAGTGRRRYWEAEALDGGGTWRRSTGERRYCMTEGQEGGGTGWRRKWTSEVLDGGGTT